MSATVQGTVTFKCKCGETLTVDFTGSLPMALCCAKCGRWMRVGVSAEEIIIVKQERRE